MSRIGKMPIEIPDKVTVQVTDRVVNVKGPKGELSKPIAGNVDIQIEDKVLKVVPLDEARETNACHGLMRALIYNMVVGVTDGFKKQLKIVGIGYRGEVKGDSLVLNVGYSNPVDFALPAGITATCSKDGMIEVMGIDKEQVGDVSAKIRKVRKPDRYKGKGIRYADETVKLKPGKSSGK